MRVCRPLRHLVLAIAVLLSLSARLNAALPAGFVRSTVAIGLTEPTTIEFTPDGRMLIAERGGRILVVSGGVVLPDPLIQITVNTDFGERGLVGLAVDPNFATNGYLYAYYTTTEPRNRVGRFTVVGNTASTASEVMIWENPALAGDFHHGGTIRFGADGNLYIATGDQENSSNSQDLSNQHGKILRVQPNGAIPADNPFVGVPGAQEAIWAYGLRNPFRFTVDSLTGNIWIGDVGGNGDDAWEEVNRGIAGANYGWPNQEGPTCYVSDCSSYTFPVYRYQHNDPDYYSTQFQGSITLGPVYRASLFPAEYQGSLLFGDYANRWMRRLTFDGGGTVTGDPEFDTPSDSGTIVDLEVGPDGALYYVNIGIPWSGSSDTPAVYRVGYVGSGNQPPIALAGADTTAGVEPLTVNFNSTGSNDPDSGPQPLTYSWTFGDSDTSTDPNPQHTYSQPGIYTARLTLDDGEDTTQSEPIEIRVGNPPSVTIIEPMVGTTYRAGDTINYGGSATDPDDGPLGPSAFVWQVVLRHAAHTHPFLGPIPNVQAGVFMIPSTGHTPEDTHYDLVVTVTDSDGLTATATRTLLPVIAPLVFDTDPSGIPIFLDGQAELTPRNYDSNPGYQHAVEAQASYVLGGTLYIFDRWSDGAARVRTYPAPEGGGSITAFYRQGCAEVASRSKLVLQKLNEPAAANTRGILWRGTFMPSGVVSPVNDGVHFSLVDSGGTVLDMNIPGGAVGAHPSTPCDPRDGWSIKGVGMDATHTYKNFSGFLDPACVVPARGIYRVILKDRRGSGGAVKFLVKGKKGNYAPVVPPTDLIADLTLATEPFTGECTSFAWNTTTTGEQTCKARPLETPSKIICKGP